MFELKTIELNNELLEKLFDKLLRLGYTYDQALKAIENNFNTNN